MDIVWLQGWCGHHEWIRARGADHASLDMLRDAPEMRTLCRLCGAECTLYRRLDGLAGPAATWICYQCLPALEVARFVSTPCRPVLHPDAMWSYFQDVLCRYHSVRFIRERSGRGRGGTIYGFSYELHSLIEEVTNPIFTFSMYDYVRGHKPYLRCLRGYFNCGLGTDSGASRLRLHKRTSTWLCPDFSSAMNARRDTAPQGS